jgi:hypothetical protein
VGKGRKGAAAAEPARCRMHRRRTRSEKAPQQQQPRPPKQPLWAAAAGQQVQARCRCRCRLCYCCHPHDEHGAVAPLQLHVPRSLKEFHKGREVLEAQVLAPAGARGEGPGRSGWGRGRWDRGRWGGWSAQLEAPPTSHPAPGARACQQRPISQGAGAGDAGSSSSSSWQRPCGGPAARRGPGQGHTAQTRRAAPCSRAAAAPAPCSEGRRRAAGGVT